MEVCVTCMSVPVIRVLDPSQPSIQALAYNMTRPAVFLLRRGDLLSLQRKAPGAGSDLVFGPVGASAGGTLGSRQAAPAPADAE